jgi:simple sugar transport system permease protein
MIPGALKAFTGAHEVVSTIMLNSLAAFVIVGLVNDVFKIVGPSFARTADVGNAAMPILFGRNGHFGIFIALALVPLTYFLLYRTTLGFEIRTTGANPSAARYAGMGPRRLIILTMSLCGMFAGLAGTLEILLLGYYPAVFGTTIGFAGITVALLGRSHPFGILFAALLLGAMRAGAPNMQIQAGVPVEIIDVIQGVILLFLAAEIVVRRLLRIRGAESATGAELATVAKTYGGERAA